MSGPNQIMHMLVLLVMAGSMLGQVAPEAPPTSRSAWVERLLAESPKVEPGDRLNIVCGLAEAGQIDQAKALVPQLEETWMVSWGLISIAAAESRADEVEAALKTAAQIEPEAWRERAISRIAIRQAQRGEPLDAMALLPSLQSPDRIDDVRRWIAEAFADAGDLDAARRAAEPIADANRRQQADAAIDRATTGVRDPLREIQPAYLRSTMANYLGFSSDGPAKRHAVSALAAAQRQDPEGFDHAKSAALQEAEGARPIDEAAVRTLLAIGLIELGRTPEAHEMIMTAHEVAEADTVRTGHLFGNPILAYLLVGLAMEEELELVESADQEIGQFGMLEAIGAAEAQAGHLDHALERFQGLDSAIDRVHFATGVLMGLGPEHPHDDRRPE